jgi:octaprenyl-diphosphate synthase
MHPLEKYREVFIADLQKVDDKIRSFGKESNVELIGLLLEHIISSGGKRLRPIILILSTKLFKVESPKSIDMAACVELLHTATLFHDDVVDESKLRRGRKTANEIWGNAASVLVGDYLLAKAFGIMSDLESLELIRIISNTSSIITKGEVKQLSFKNNLSISEEDYIDIITAKTAELFSACCRVGAEIALQDNIAKDKLEEFGRNQGIAFQITDDVIDYMSEKSTAGKKIGDDFREGKVTMPVIHLYKNANEQERKYLSDIFKADNDQRNDEELTKITQLMSKYGSIEYTKNRAKEFSSKSKELVNSFDTDLIDVRIKEILLEILEFSVDRNF